MPESADTKRMVLVAYALSKALFQQVNGGALKGDAMRMASGFLPKPPSDAAQEDLQAWRDADAELRTLVG